MPSNFRKHERLHAGACAAVLFVCTALAFELSAQTARPTQVEQIAPRLEDVSTIDGIIKAYYETITGPVGKPREWARDRTLYLPSIRLISLSMKEGKPVADIMSHQEYVDGSNDFFLKNGFFEKEIHRVTHRFGNMVQVFSTYEARNTADGPVIARGINGLQLYFDGVRWWITAAMWDDERPENPIPKEFLP
ncbi:nuclear transport factor 2 family protein [candidate division KSB1 bacterium]|nr:nuclear transport factor 2 family protein [candidate division KSB1 bacterium]